MNCKLATTYGVLSWALVYVIASLLNPFIVDDIPYIDITIPIAIIIVTSTFGILYIRNFDSNEILEGFKLGLVFFITDLICDFFFLKMTNIENPLIENYPVHILSMLIMFPLITTFIGYLAQMEIELR